MHKNTVHILQTQEVVRIAFQVGLHNAVARFHGNDGYALLFIDEFMRLVNRQPEML